MAFNRELFATLHLNPHDENAYDKAIVQNVQAMSLKEAMRVLYDLAAENRIEDTEGDLALEAMQFEQDVALEKVWTLIMEME